MAVYWSMAVLSPFLLGAIMTTDDLIFEMQKWKMWAWKTITADELVMRGPGFLGCATVASNSSGVCSSLIYDGYDANGRLLLAMACKDDDMEISNFHLPLYFRQGLYVDIGDNVLGLTLHFIPDMAHVKGYPDPV